MVTDSLPEQNQGNLDLYEVDPEDPYEIDEDGSFLGIAPGDALDTHRDGLREGDAPGRFFIDGAEGSELGYLTAEAGQITGVFITAPNVVTRNGIRVGYSLAELTERIGETRALGDGLRERDGLTYRLAGGRITEIGLR